MAGFDQEIAALDDVTLDVVARNLVILEDIHLIGFLSEVLQSDPTTSEGRSDRIQIILAASVRQAIGYAMPYFTLHYRGFQFIKKSPLRLSRHGAEATLNILSQLEGPMAQRAYAEAQEIFEQRSDL